MKRFLLFWGDIYYPSGGWGDFKGSYDTIEEALDKCTKAEWYQIVDISTGTVIKEAV